MSLRVCAEPDCPTLTTKSRCDRHERERERARGTREARGYGAQHKAERKRWLPLVATGHVKCARCRLPIEPESPWDLDHRDDRAGYIGPSHASCNRSAARRISPSA